MKKDFLVGGGKTKFCIFFHRGIRKKILRKVTNLIYSKKLMETYIHAYRHTYILHLRSSICNLKRTILSWTCSISKYYVFIITLFRICNTGSLQYSKLLRSSPLPFLHSEYILMEIWQDFLDMSKKKILNIYLHQKMRFTPFFDNNNILGWILFVYRAK